MRSNYIKFINIDIDIENIRSMCSSRRSFVMLREIPDISMHSRQNIVPFYVNLFLDILFSLNFYVGFVQKV